MRRALPASISLALCIATVGLWVRSYRSCDVFLRQHQPRDRWCVTSEFGLLAFERETRATPPPRPGWEFFLCPLPRRWPVRVGRLGFDAYRGSNRHYVHGATTPLVGVTAPHWSVVALLAVLPALELRRRGLIALRRRRKLRNLCPSCGYDLRAGHARCPECGAQCARHPESCCSPVPEGTDTTVRHSRPRFSIL